MKPESDRPTHVSRMALIGLIMGVISLAAGAFSAGYNLGVGMATLKCLKHQP